MKTMQLPETIDLAAVFFSGQTFRWQKTDFGYAGSVEENAAAIFTRDENLVLFWDGPADESYWRNYFDLERNYGEIAEKYSRDERLRAAFSSCRGLRILNQPLWETLCAFIISANNNDKRIRLIMRKLCESLGEEKMIEETPVRLFPSPQTIAGAGAGKLRELGLGYRAEYLADTARKVAGGYDLSLLKEIGYDEALRELMSFKGVGDKVASCVLLFSCGYSRAFPVDVWMERVMQSLFSMRGTRKSIREKSEEMFGGDAGIVQQFLFHSARNGNLSL